MVQNRAQKEAQEEIGKSVKTNNTTMFLLDFCCPSGSNIEGKIKKIGSKTIRNWSALPKAIFEGFWSILKAILGAKMEPKSKKNGIKNKSDFKTKL